MRRDYRLVSLAHKVFYSKDWSAYLPLLRYTPALNLRSSDAVQLVVPKEEGNFQHTCQTFQLATEEH